MVMKDDIYEDVTSLLNCTTFEAYDINFTEKHLNDSIKKDFATRESRVHNKARLPESFSKHRNGHFGSHQFLVDDFIKAVSMDKLPPNHVWVAADYCAPGIIAHESAKKSGLLMDVPDFGSPPPSKSFLNPDEGHEWGCSNFCRI